MSDLFESTAKQKWNRSSSEYGFWGKIKGLRKDKKGCRRDPIYCLRGMVCYYGKHFVSIFQADTDDEGVARFLLFDDSRVRIIGNWNDVKKEAVKAHYQPVLLLFELKTVDEQEEEAKTKKISARFGGKSGASSESKSPIRIFTESVDEVARPGTPPIPPTLERARSAPPPGMGYAVTGETAGQLMVRSTSHSPKGQGGSGSAPHSPVGPPFDVSMRSQGSASSGEDVSFSSHSFMRVGAPRVGEVPSNAVELAGGLRVATAWGKESQYRCIKLMPELVFTQNGVAVPRIGLVFDLTEKGMVVTGFYNSPSTNQPFTAEVEGQVLLLDVLLSVNGESVAGMDLDEAHGVLCKHGVKRRDSSREDYVDEAQGNSPESKLRRLWAAQRLELVFESTWGAVTWFICPYCMTREHVVNEMREEETLQCTFCKNFLCLEADPNGAGAGGVGQGPM